MPHVTSTYNQQEAQLSQTDHTAGCVSFGQKWKTKYGRQYFMDIIVLSSSFNHCNIISQQSYWIRWKKNTQNKGYYAVQGHSRSLRSIQIESPYMSSY